MDNLQEQLQEEVIREIVEKRICPICKWRSDSFNKESLIIAAEIHAQYHKDKINQ